MQAYMADMDPEYNKCFVRASPTNEKASHICHTYLIYIIA